MVKSRYLCGGSALAVSLALLASPALAQQPSASAQELDNCYSEAGDDEAKLSACDTKANAVAAVVSTGSRIRGLPEDAALPVEVVTRDDLLEKGSPSVLDLMRSLSEIGAVQGESNRGATGYGNNSVNLRGLGSGRTLALINGRRIGDAPAEAAVTSGNFQDVSSVPSAALQQVEVLKDGGTTTYGADAVAGVVNFITRRDLNGLEVNAAYKFVDGSDGDPELSVLWGRRNDVGNLLLGFQYQGRGELKCFERDSCLKEPFRTDEKEITGALTTSNANPGAFQVQVPSTGLLGFNSINTTAAAGNVLRYVGAGTNYIFPAISATGTMRDQGCDEIGGYKGFNATPSPVCYFNRAYTDNLVDEQHNYLIFGDANIKLSDAIQYHNEFSIRRQTIDVVQGVVDGMNNSPCEPLPALAPAQVNNADTARNCIRNQFGTSAAAPTAAYSAAGYNPAVADYFGRLYSLNGAQRALTGAQFTALTGATLPGVAGPPTGQYALAGVPRLGPSGQPVATGGNGGRVVFPQLSWQIFGWGANPAFEDGLEHMQVDNYTFRTVQQMKVDFGKVFGVTLDLDLSGTYQRDMQVYQDRGILVDRLQRALNGFATDLDDADGDICTADETRAPRTYADPDGTGPLVSGTVNSVAFTAGAGGGANTYTNVTGFAVTPTTGIDPDGTGPLTARNWAGNGCYFLNPFSTASGYNPYRNIQSPTATANTFGFVGGPAVGGSFGDYQGYSPGYGLANSPGIARWLYEERSRRITTDNVFFDLALNGDFGGLSLPGGPLGWAAGTQWRYVTRSTNRDRLSDRAATPCPFRTTANADPVFQSGIAGSVADSQLRREDSSTCTTNDNGPWADAGGGNVSYRQTRTTSFFGEIALPFHDRVTGQLAYRWEQENQNSSTSDGVGIYSGSIKWQVTPNFSLRASAGDTFDPIPIPDPNINRNEGDTALGATFTTTNLSGNSNTETLALANTSIGPETGFNYNVGIIWQTPDRRLFGTVDFFHIDIEGEPATISATSIGRALAGIPLGAIPMETPIDCTSPVVQQLFNQFESALDTGNGPRPVVGYRDGTGAVSFADGCRPGTNFAGSPNGDALSIAYLTSVNAGTSRVSGIDARMSYAHPDPILGGNVEVTLDATYNIQRGAAETLFLGTVISPADNLLGQLQSVSYNIWRGSIGVNYRRGRHALSWQTRAFSTLRSTAGTFALSSPAFNYNPADTSLCSNATLPPNVLGGIDQNGIAILGPGGVGEGNYDANCNTPYTESHVLDAKFNTDVTYRIDLPEYRANAFISIYNLFDQAPAYWGVTFGYDTSGGIGPLGRQIKVGMTKTF